MKEDYSDIINLPHHVSKNHPQMPMTSRAAQFAPFAALTGYDAVIHPKQLFIGVYLLYRSRCCGVAATGLALVWQEIGDRNLWMIVKDGHQFGKFSVQSLIVIFL